MSGITLRWFSSFSALVVALISAPASAGVLEDFGRSHQTNFSRKEISDLLEAAQRESLEAITARAENVQRMGARIVRPDGFGEPGDFPWMVFLASPAANGDLIPFCGGALIDAQWILTAAHCRVTRGDRAVVGRTDFAAAGGRVIAIDRVVTHEGYGRQNHDSDLALVRLVTPVAQTAVLELVDDVGSGAEIGVEATVLGWGRTSENGALSRKLAWLEVPIVDDTVCRQAYAAFPHHQPMTEAMLCAGFQQGGKDSCYGDSGGPLVVKSPRNGRWLQAGIVSFGEGCARPDAYGVYVRVSKFRSWIATHVAR